MEEHLKIVWFLYYVYHYLTMLLFKGQSGDTFTGLSDGAHTIDVRFTPEGTSQMFNLQQLRFSIGNNSYHLFTV